MTGHLSLRRLVRAAAVWAFLVVPVAAAVTAAPALADGEPYDVWVVPSTAKVFPDSAPGATRTVTLGAAGNEYEAAQLAVSLPAADRVTLDWQPGSDPLLSANGEVFRVHYVTVTRPSTGVGSRAGPYPDPLLPAGFGVPVDLPAGTTSFYVRLHVPYETPAGLHEGGLTVTGSQGSAVVPVSLRVRDFGWARPSLHTSFGMSIESAMNSVADAVPDTPANRVRLGEAYYRFFADHWLSPKQLRPRPTVDRLSGRLDTTGITDLYGPLLGLPGGSDGLFWDTSYQLDGSFPFAGLDPVMQAPLIEAYLRDLLAVSRANAWDRRSYLYAYDEPGYGAERDAEALAEIAHDVSAELGFRARVLLTAWPRPVATGGRAANAFLFDDVDIWCPSVYRFFDSLPALDERRAQGADVWWYTYASREADRFPTFLIDEPLGEERGFAWMTWRNGASGILYWGTTRWGDAVTSDGYRDPYADPVSYAWRTGWRANGEACLIYPGYYPALGLTDPWAEPVSSLRLEALRDGIEDYEYLRLATRTRTGDAASAAAAEASAAVAAAITDYPYGAYPRDYRNVPSWSSDPRRYEAAREHLADYIERAQRGEAPAIARGTVVDAATGRPVGAAKVGDGLLATTTGRDGAFVLRGVLPPATLVVTHPLYESATVLTAAGDETAAVVLQRRASARLLSGFEKRARFTVVNGSSSSSTAWATGGASSARVVLRGSRATATLSLPPGSRDLRHATSIHLDVRNPATIDHARPWFVRFSVSDARRRTVSKRFLLRPEGDTRLSLSLLRSGLDRRRVTRVRLTVEPGGTRTLFVDTLAVR